jgi:hypothetical protein
MTISARDYALLDKDSYNNRENDKNVELDGVTYRVFDHYDNPITGYHGTAYQRLDTGEIVITHRGTDAKHSLVQDGLTDLGMVITGFNAQLPDAEHFTRRVIDEATKEASRNRTTPPRITISGHSLGGALTEATAYKFGLQGVTFNGYGAVDLGYNIPQGDNQVTHYVRVTDFVSAASHHFGHVVELATADDIARLRNAGYVDGVTADDLRNPWSAKNFAAHSIDNFAPDHPQITPSDLSQENIDRAHAHRHAIHLFREDLQSLRANTFSLPWELQKKQATAATLVSAAAMATLHGDFHEAGKLAELTEHRTEANVSQAWDTTTQTTLLSINAIDHAGSYVADQIKGTANDVGQSTSQMLAALNQRMQEDINALQEKLKPAPLRLDDPSHPDHAMYQQAREGVHKLDAQHQRTPDQRSDQLAAALVVSARRHGLTRIDDVTLHRDAKGVSAWEHAPAGADWWTQYNHGLKTAAVPTVEALNTPIEQSSQQWPHAVQQRQAEQQAQEQQQQQWEQQRMQQPHHGMSR